MLHKSLELYKIELNLNYFNSIDVVKNLELAKSDKFNRVNVIIRSLKNALPWWEMF